MTKQEAVIKYITENYLEYNRLRHDVISDKLQLRMEKPTPDPFLKDGGNSAAHKSFPSGEDLGEAVVWREMTKQDINSIVCHCAQEYDTNITSREVITTLQSDLIPNVHPLREYILSLRPYTPDQPDWIDFIAQQVRVRESATDRCEAPVDRHFVAVDGRSAAPVVFHNESTASNASELQCSASDIDRTRGAVDRAEPCRSAAPEDRPTGCSVSRESTASITSELQCSASDIDRTRGAVDRAEPCRSAAPVDGRLAAPEDRPTGCSVSRESTASNASELQCSASDIDRTRGAVDRAEPCRSAAPEDRPTGCSVSRESTASITSDLQCSASDIDRTRGAVDRAEPCRLAAPEDRPTGCSVSRESTASITSDLQCSASDIARTRGAVDWAEPCRSAAPEDRPTGCSVSRESTASITSELQCSASDIARTKGAVDWAEPCRSAAPVVFHNESTASNASDLQCSASETNYSEANYSEATHSSQSERSEADRLWRVCFKKWFVAMVASWMRDEVVNHQVLVLIGRQGIYKTTWLEHLIPPHLRAYTCKLANSTDLNKDERMRIAEFGLISLDEIDSMNNRELNQLKSIITATDVNERAAYAYTKERRIRLASFCASGNRRDFLTDITGNRRWLPFEVESILNPFHTILPYEQLYAQAWALAQDPLFSFWFDLDEIEVLEQHNQHFRDESNEEQLLPILFDVPAEGKGEFMTTAQISERLVTYGNIKKPMALSRLGMVLGTAGYKATKRKIGNTQTRGWIVYQRDTDEISALRRILKD